MSFWAPFPAGKRGSASRWEELLKVVADTSTRLTVLVYARGPGSGRGYRGL